MTREPDFVRAKRKINEATNWRGDVSVSLGQETVTFKHRLLTESEFLELQRELDKDALSEDGDGDVAPSDMGETEAQERLLALQEKEDLTEEEERELRELTQEVAGQTDRIERALGEDGYELLMDMGRRVIEPSEEDVGYVFDLMTEEPAEAIRMMGMDSLPENMTRGEVNERLRSELRSMIDDQPYPIKLNVGMQAMAETISVLGNGLQT
jgi:hypothetical protein